MKKTLLIFLQVLLASFSVKLMAQAQPFNVTPNGLFDDVYDRDGIKHRLLDLAIIKDQGNARPIGNNNFINSAPTVFCQAGYFTLYYDPNSVTFITGANAAAARAVLCELYTNISGFVNSTIPAGSINIFCTDVPGGGSVYGYASPYYVYPAGTANLSQGVLLNQVQKALLTGADPYASVPMGLFANTGGNVFYHGNIFANSAVPWNYNLMATSIGASEYSFYGTMLHEALHMLGILSLIGPNGNSILPQNYYTAYDQFLTDGSGTPLIVPSAPACPVSNLGFNSGALSLSALQPGTCPGTTNLTNCSLAVKFLSPNVDVKVYTPDCWEQGSSLMHFEDMCSTSLFTPSGPTGCTPSPATPGYNDLYFCMANASMPGNCYVKKYPKKEERCALVDLGYSVNSSYSSTGYVSGTATTFNYQTGGCSTAPHIYGVNDGFSGGVYTYATNGSSLSIPLIYLIANDIPYAGTQVSCVELVYGSVTSPPVISGSNLLVNSFAGSGLVVVKYVPTDGSGLFGTPAYVFLYFNSPGCTQSSSCNLVQNGGFETTTGLSTCGSVGANNLAVSCWADYQAASFIFSTASGCSPYPFVQLGVNTFSTTPAVPSYAGSQCAGLQFDEQSGSSNASVIKTSLASPLAPGQTYQATFWIMNREASVPTSSSNINPNSYATVITLASNPSFNVIPSFPYPSNLNVLGQITVNAGSVWQQVSLTFVYNGATPANALFIGINAPASLALGSYAGMAPKKRMCFLDDVSVSPYPGATFAIPPTTLCGPTTVLNLAQYASLNGTFSGPGVTQSGSVYNFNSPVTLPAGTYPITFNYTYNGCPFSAVSQVASGQCCSGSNTQNFTQTTVLTTTLIGNPGATMKIVNSFDIHGGATCIFYPGEYVMENGVQITVRSGATLRLEGTHLHTCGNFLWKGIVVEDGGLIETFSYLGNDCLIEDAETAIDASNQILSPFYTILNIKNTIFNKNYVDVKFSNNPCASSSFNNVLSFQNCVFTCRDLPFSVTSWPGTSVVSGLRSATNPTTGIAAPYLFGNAPITNLKAPYSMQRSHIAISMENVGTAIPAAAAPGVIEIPYDFEGVHLGFSNGTVPANDFLLFDAHENFIVAANTSATITNCVFQNTQTYLDNNSVLSAGAAINFTNNIQNTRLNLNGPNQSAGNRFWDCHKAIEANGQYDLYINNSIFRSTQSLANPPSATNLPPGRSAVNIITNRFENYGFTNNEFTNVSNGISLIGTAASFSTTGFAYYAGPPVIYPYLIYMRNLNIESNTFSPETSLTFAGTTSNYVRNCVTIGGPTNYFAWATPGIGIHVNNNIMYRVFNGIRLGELNSIGMTNHADSPAKLVVSNKIMIEPESGSTATQRGIEFVDNLSAPSGFPTFTVYSLQSIEQNSIAAFGTGAASNPHIALMFNENNGGAGNNLMPSPYVLCNTLSNAHQGFVFDMSCNPSYLRGNTMQTLEQGLALTGGGVIGQQGAPGAPSDNVWQGSWSSASQTYVDGSSTPVNSKLYVQNNTGYVPTYNNSAITGQNYTSGNTILFTSGSYLCGGPYTQKNAPLPDYDKIDDNLTRYISKMHDYHFVDVADSLRNSNDTLNDFHESLAGTTFDKFTRIEKALDKANTDDADEVIAMLDQSAFNTVEANYFSYYMLLNKYIKDPTTFNESDRATLSALADLCPAKNGACVQQARMMYLMIMGHPFSAHDNCSDTPGKKTSGLQAAASTGWNVDVFPNPATNQISIAGKKESEALNVTICDISGRQILAKDLKSSGFIAKLDLQLINGAYFITISNATNEKVTKKLLIAK